ncbi:MAG: hypothetical protein NUV94_07535 [Candidatus Acetothermia bacterium]|jgi:hypothetical protein|nr:hypothetical protein [Candidatus Acetothermia bacterium]
MSPFNLFLVLAIVGAVLSMANVAITDCSQGVALVLDGTVVGKTIVVREKDRVVTTGCPTCPGASPTKSVVVITEEVYFVVAEATEGGKTSQYRVEVDARFYREAQPGAPVELRLVRGKRTGLLCGRPEIIVKEPSQ